MAVGLAATAARQLLLSALLVDAADQSRRAGTFVDVGVCAQARLARVAL